MDKKTDGIVENTHQNLVDCSAGCISPSELQLIVDLGLSVACSL